MDTHPSDNSLTAAERCCQLARRKALYLRLHPETGRGVAGAKASNRVQGKGDATAPDAVASETSFVADTSAKTGMAERTVRKYVQVGEALRKSGADELLIRNELKTLERCEHLERRKRLYLELHPETAQGTAGANRRWDATEIISVASFSEDAAAKLVADTAAKTGMAPSTVRKEVYETLHPETKAGVAQATGMHLSLGHNVGGIITPTFVEDTAAKTGVSKSTIQQEVKIAADLMPEVKTLIRDTPPARPGQWVRLRG